MNLHLYGGLVTCWYLLILGYTSLGFNHPALQFKSSEPKVHSERPLAIPTATDDLKLAEEVRDQLGLIGWPLPWNMKHDVKNDLGFEMGRPGRKYWIQLDRSAGKAKIESENQSVFEILRFLHGSTEGVPISRYMTAWGLYTEVTTWFVLFAVGSGVILWAQRERNRRLALGILIGCAVISLAFMGYLYFVG